MSKKGYKQTEEHKQKIGLANKGKISYWKGKERGKQTEEHRKKLSEGHKGYIIKNHFTWKGKKLSDEHKNNLSLAKKGKPNVNLRGDKNPWWKGGKPNCLDCNKKLSTYNAKRCNRCANILRMKNEDNRKKISIALKGKYIGSLASGWKGGITCEPYSIDWNMTLKRSIRERDKYICQVCNKQQEDRAFAVHHIDYNKLNCNPENLITLCRSCHQKTNFNRNYWIKYFLYGE